MENLCFFSLVAVKIWCIFAADTQVRIRNLRTERESLFINLKSVIYNEIQFL